jgi:hypothetical protein
MLLWERGIALAAARWRETQMKEDGISRKYAGSGRSEAADVGSRRWNRGVAGSRLLLWCRSSCAIHPAFAPHTDRIPESSAPSISAII